MGLSLCQGIIEGHGGTIRLQSRPGQGATFHVELPIPRQRRPAGPVTRMTVPSVSRKVLLVVDDEPDVAGLLADLLTIEGHTVDTADNGVTAMEKIRSRKFDMVLSDIRMPELDGPSLYHEIEHHHPELVPRIVFLTGDTLGPDSCDFLARPGIRSLVKPFSAEDVRRAVWETFQI